VSFISFLQARPWPARIAISLAALALLFAASQLLPFAGGKGSAPKVLAYSGGYVLIFDFGQSPPPESIHQQGKEIVEDWIAANKIQPDELDISGGQDIVDGNVTFTLGLIGASLGQAESLVEALKALPGIPSPRVVEAQWYQVEAVEAEKRGEVLLYEFDHAFVFSRGTTGAQMEQAIRDYLIESRGSCDYEIAVDAEWTGRGHSINIEVTALEGQAEAKHAGKKHLLHGTH
jgi:hypothetical protein